jgi:ribosomal-protein-serine acetyltransferase
VSLLAVKLKGRSNAEIRLIQHTDADRIWEPVDANRAYLRRWLPWLDRNTSIEDTRKFITLSLRSYANNGSMTFVITDDEEVQGVCGFNLINKSIKPAISVIG